MSPFPVTELPAFLPVTMSDRRGMMSDKAWKMSLARGYETQHHETYKAGDMVWGSQSAIVCALCACFDTRKIDEQNPEAAF